MMNNVHIIVYYEIHNVFTRKKFNEKKNTDFVINQDREKEREKEHTEEFLLVIFLHDLI